jgi:hypothetical protein
VATSKKADETTTAAATDSEPGAGTMEHTHAAEVKTEATVEPTAHLDTLVRPASATTVDPVPGSEGPRSQSELDARDAS